MNEHEWAEKLAHIQETHRALERARANLAKEKTADSALLVQRHQLRLRELRSTIPKPQLVSNA